MLLKMPVERNDLDASGFKQRLVGHVRQMIGVNEDLGLQTELEAVLVKESDVITSFFDRFPLEDQNHIVILILNKSKAKRLLHYFDKAKCQDSLDSLANSNSTNPFANKKKQNETCLMRLLSREWIMICLLTT